MTWSSLGGGEVATTSINGRQTARYGRAARRRAKAVVRRTRSAPSLDEVHDEVTPAVRQGGTRERIVFGSALAARAAPSTLSSPLGCRLGDRCMKSGPNQCPVRFRTRCRRSPTR